jgi:glycosyltransferase 2 family protein
MPAEPADERRSGAGWKLALRLGLSAVFLIVLFTRVPDLDGVHLPDTHPLRTAVLLGVAIVAACVGIILSAWRWQQVLRLFDAHVPLPTLTRHYFAGQFVSNVMPSTVGGDVVRIARCAKNVGSTTVAFGSVVLERLSGMIALPLLVVVGFALKPSLLHADHAWFALVTASATLGVLVLIVIMAGHPGLAGRFAANENWTRFIGAVFIGVDRARRDVGQAGVVLATAIAYQLSIVGAYAVIFRALDVDVPIAAALAFVPAVSMLQVIPISFGGIGVREGALWSFRYGLGIPGGAAVTAGLLWYASLFVVSLIGAPIFAIGQRNTARLDDEPADRPITAQP